MSVRMNKLRWIREDQGLTQAYLAVHAGTSPGYISNMERYGYYPGERLRRRIARVLCVPENNIWPEGV